MPQGYIPARVSFLTEFPPPRLILDSSQRLTYRSEFLRRFRIAPPGGTEVDRYMVRYVINETGRDEGRVLLISKSPWIHPELMILFVNTVKFWNQGH